MDFQVLGPLRAVANGVDVEVRGAKERTLLMHLIASAGHVVPSSDLVDSLWPHDPPRTAAKSLQTYVLRLRNSLEPERAGEPRLLVTTGTGYRLAITDRQTDAGRFVRLVGLARSALEGQRWQAALDAAHDALGLWRGPAYPGCEQTVFGPAEVRRLGELRVQAEECRLEAMLALGQEAAVVPEVERVVTDHPLRERLWELLMLASYRAGRQGAALDAYDRARAVLADELGVDPGAGLRELHAKVLAQDPSLDRARPRIPDGLRHGPDELVGRAAEIATLRDVWHRTVAGATGVAVVRGPAGAGATALAAALAREVAERHSVLLGAEPAPSSGPWLRVVERVTRVPAEPEPGAMLLVLARPGDPVPGGAAVVDLAPLTDDEVRRVVAAYAPPEEVEALADAVAATGVAWPGHVHAEAARLAREAASQRLGAAVGVVARSSARLAAARADVSDSIVRLSADDDRVVEPGVCPWRGLASYDVADAPWFAGREHLVAELLSRLASARLLAVVGTSGSGKSSTVRAGVLAALAADGLPGSSSWHQVVLRPGRHPMRELARAALGRQPEEVGDLLARLLHPDGAPTRTLVVVDQMEEVWTSCGDEGEREAFLDTLAELAGDPDSSTTVLLVLRADYVGEAADHAQLAALLADGTVLVGSPTAAEVRRAVTRPAARAGLQVEEGLADTIVSDAGDEPGLLPLLSVALTQVWAQREGDRLTFAGYVAGGGLRGAIASLAEQVWGELDEAGRLEAQHVLLRLAGPGEGAGVARRRVPLAEVEALGRPGLRRVLDRLADARLVTVGDGHVEVAHEALFREWPRLRGWLTDDAAGRVVQRRLALAATEWDADGREPTGLWRGTRLQSGLDVASARPDELTRVEVEFLERSRSALEAEQEADRRRAVATARQNRRLRWLLVGAVCFLVFALVAGTIALRARADAQESAADATSAARRADARALAADALNEDRPALALLQAVEAARRDAGPETFGALLTMLTRSPDAVTRFRIADRFLRISSSADGRTVFVSDNTTVLRALDTTTADLVWEADSEDGQWGNAVQAPGADWVAVPVFGDPEVGVLAILDARTGETRHLVTGADLRRDAPDTSLFVDEAARLTADGAVVLTTETHAFVVDPRTGRVQRATAVGPHSSYSVPLPDGRIGFQLEPAHTLLLDPVSGRSVRRSGVVVGADPATGRVLTSSTTKDASGAESSELTVRTSAWRPLGRSWQVPGYVRGALFVPGRHHVAVAVDESLRVFDVRTHAPVRDVDVHSGALLQMTLAGPDGDLIWTAGRDGTAVAIDTTGTRGVLRRLPTDVRGDIAAAAGDRAIVTNVEEVELNTASVLDLATDRVIVDELQPVTGCRCQPGQVAITPDGRLGLVGIIEYTRTWDRVVDRGRVVVLDTGTGEVVRTLETPWEPAGLAASPDGRHVLVNGTGGWGLWDITTAEEVWRHDDATRVDWAPGAPQVEYAGDGSVVALSRGEDVLLLDAGSGEELRRTELAGSFVPGRMVFDAEAGTLVVGSFTGRLYFLDARTLERTHPDRLVTAGFVLDLELSPDGRMLAAMGTDGDVTLFDTASWRPYGKPVVDKLGWGFLEFTDEDTLVIRGELGGDYEIDTDPQVWLETACRAANTAFTPEESAVILPGEPVAPTCG